MNREAYNLQPRVAAAATLENVDEKAQPQRGCDRTNAEMPH